MTRWTSALVAAAVLQVVGVYLPSAPPVPDTGAVPIDKVAHFVLFGLPALLAAPALGRRGAQVVWGALVVHAPISEWLQMAVLPHRSGDWHDAVADLVGVAVGIGVGSLLARRSAMRPVGDRRARW